jgi:hypothetical protein
VCTRPLAFLLSNNTSIPGAPGFTMVFQNANYFLNFQKLLGIAKGVKVDNETSQQQIIKMYKLGHEIPWDMRKAQPAIQQVLIGTQTERARGCCFFFDVHVRGRLTTVSACSWSAKGTSQVSSSTRAAVSVTTVFTLHRKATQWCVIERKTGST